MASNNEPQLTKFAAVLGIDFHNLALLQEALTHRSFINENRAEADSHNERMEFLGDAVLELIVTEFLFQKYPDRPEGELTSFRAALVRTESLAEAAAKLGYGDHIFMSKGEEATGGRGRPYILANTFEAVIGAIYLDQGFEVTKTFIHQHLLPKTEEIVANRLDIDPKSKLQEVAQEMLKSTPAYELVAATGPDHDKVFEMQVIIAGANFGTGSGRSKQEAEQNAAASALRDWEQLYQKHQEKPAVA